MAFADPQSINISGTTTSLPRTGSGNGVGQFTSNDGAQTLSITQQSGKRIRRVALANLKKYSVNPLDTTLNVPVNASVSLVINQPVQGFTVAELTTMCTGLFTSLTASTNANLIKLLGGES